MIERPGMRPPPGVFRPPTQPAPAGLAPTAAADGKKDEGEKKEETKEEEEKKKKPIVPSGPPKPETPWERGLRQAKEVCLFEDNLKC